jgi:putative intracellular protease/amidase
MMRVEKGSAAAAPMAARPPGVRAAVLIFDGVQVIDFAAPYEVFGQAGYEVFTVAPEARPITTAMGLLVTPRYALAEAPAAQVLLVPGGDVGGAQRDPRVLEWLRTRGASAAHVLSVCNGAFILAASGMLDGLQATTFYDLIEPLRQQAPKVTVVSDRRFVDNGKVITTAGLSSGIDGALHVVARLSGKGRAQMAALNMEYDWKADGRYSRASFADAPIRKVLGRGLLLPLPGPERAEVTSTGGDEARWEVVWSLATARPAGAVVEGVASALDGRSGWTRDRKRAGEGAEAEAAFAIADAGGRFRGSLRASGEGRGVRVALRVLRERA